LNLTQSYRIINCSSFPHQAHTTDGCSIPPTAQDPLSLSLSLSLSRPPPPSLSLSLTPSLSHSLASFFISLFFSLSLSSFSLCLLLPSSLPVSVWPVVVISSQLSSAQ